MTVNLATALAARGLNVGILDADIYGHSIPHMLGSDARPHQVDDMIMPPIAHGVKIISIGHFVEGNTPVIWRGPMLHRAIQQFLSEAFWSDLDILLLDLPPGTGDIALSVAQLVPSAELLIVTTPQAAAAEVAERAGAMSQQTRQKVAGVIENMSAMVMPDGSVVDVFGSGGGQMVADRLSTLTGTKVELLGSVPLDSRAADWCRRRQSHRHHRPRLAHRRCPERHCRQIGHAARIPRGSSTWTGRSASLNPHYRKSAHRPPS